MLVAPVRKDVSRTVLRSARATGGVDLEDVFGELEREAIEAMGEEGLGPADMVLTRRIDARYAGQSYELTVPATGWVDAFHAAHQRQFGFASPGDIVQAVSLRVEAVAREAIDARFPAPPEQPGAPVGTERVRHDGRSLETTRWDRSLLGVGQTFKGPALVVEYSATLWVPLGTDVEVLESAALLLSTASG
jgi:N-methylhydantoinase A